jgi:para-nitrobenzyl esterase
MFRTFLQLLLFLRVSATLVRLPDGTRLQGKERDSTLMFLGVPYAMPPVGSLRWAPPQIWKNEDTSKIVDATKYGAPCCQGFTKLTLGDEDCLFLNIYVPSNTNATNLPVGFFIHGGSYRTGTGNMYSGNDMVKYFGGQGIIVTVNYRLNVSPAMLFSTSVDTILICNMTIGIWIYRF